MKKLIIETLLMHLYRIGIQRQLGDSMPALDPHRVQSMAERLSFANNPSDIVDAKLDDLSKRDLC